MKCLSKFAEFLDFPGQPFLSFLKADGRRIYDETYQIILGTMLNTMLT